MMDFHDKELTDWRNDILGDLEEFCHSNMLSSVPRKFSYVLWLLILSLSTLVSIAGSFLLKGMHTWLSGMLGNLSAGLLASILILLYTTNKDKNISYYESLLPSLKEVMYKADRVFNRLYFLQRELRNNGQQKYIEQYNVFAMKVLLSHKMLLELYRQVKSADKMKFDKFLLNDTHLSEHEKSVDYYQLQVAIECCNKSNSRLDEFDLLYNNIWCIEMKMMRSLHGYIEYVQSNVYTMKYGKK